MWCEGRVLDTQGNPVPNCTIETWETDNEGLCVTVSFLRCSLRSHYFDPGTIRNTKAALLPTAAVASSRMRMGTTACVGFIAILNSVAQAYMTFMQYRAVLPTPYPIPNDGPVGRLLKTLNRHVFRPAHLHTMLVAKGYETLITALYFKGDQFLES